MMNSSAASGGSFPYLLRFSYISKNSIRARFSVETFKAQLQPSYVPVEFCDIDRPVCLCSL
jgi:hypothetical protein